MNNIDIFSASFLHIWFQNCLKYLYIVPSSWLKVLLWLIWYGTTKAFCLQTLYLFQRLNESFHVTFTVSVWRDFKIFVICDSVTSSPLYREGAVRGMNIWLKKRSLSLSSPSPFHFGKERELILRSLIIVHARWRLFLFHIT